MLVAFDLKMCVLETFNQFYRRNLSTVITQVAIRWVAKHVPANNSVYVGLIRAIAQAHHS